MDVAATAEWVPQQLISSPVLFIYKQWHAVIIDGEARTSIVVHAVWGR